MRRTSVATTTHQAISQPRGWIVLGAALASWALFIGAGSVMAQLFTYVGSAIW